MIKTRLDLVREKLRDNMDERFYYKKEIEDDAYKYLWTYLWYRLFSRTNRCLEGMINERE